MRARKQILFGLAVSLVLLLAGCQKTEPATVAAKNAAPALPAGVVVIPADSPKLSSIKMVTVEIGTVPDEEVESPGRIETNPNRVGHVVLPVAGRVVSVNTKIGEFVKQGQPLLTLESPDIDTAISLYTQAEAAVNQAKIAATKSQADLDRLRDLYANRAVAQKEVLSAEAVFKENQLGVDQAEAAKQQARRKLEIYGVKPGPFGQRITVNAPISGKVMEMSVVPGEFRNDISASLMTIADLSTVWVTADVPETQIRLINVGEHVDIEMAAYPGDKFGGRVTQVADSVDPQTRTIKVRAQIENRDGRLRPEMFATIRHSDGAHRVPLLPLASIVQAEGSMTVWREESPGRFHQVPVTLGNKSGKMVAVLSGVRGGDRVVVDGVMLLKAN